MNNKNIIAVDLGASSGRVILGTFDGEKIKLAEQFRFSNEAINLSDSLYWDYLNIFNQIKKGIVISSQAVNNISSISVDSWGVDYGYIDSIGKILCAPHSYRDTRVEKFNSMFDEILSPRDLFELTGTQSSTIISAKQIYVDLLEQPYLRSTVNKVLFISNLFEYFLSNNPSSDNSLASTTGLFDLKNAKYSENVLNKLSIDKKWFLNVHSGGRNLGMITQGIKHELKITDDIRVLSSVGHDTAAATLALPITDDQLNSSAFISSGTWSIVGIKTKFPIITKEAFSAGLTNELCFNGENQLIKNITGLWIIQELKKEWDLQGEKLTFDEMKNLAEHVEITDSFINVNLKEFLLPGNMEDKINKYLLKTQQKQPHSKGELLRIVYESLALEYAKVIRTIEKTTNRGIHSIYILGGGVNNDLLLNLTSYYTQKTIYIGPSEASALGNVISQLEMLKLIGKENRIAIINNSFNFKRITNMNNENRKVLMENINKYDAVCSNLNN